MAFLAAIPAAMGIGGGATAAGSAAGTGLAAATVAEGATIGASAVGAGTAMGTGMAAAEAAGTGLFAGGGSALVGGAAATTPAWLSKLSNGMQGAGTLFGMGGDLMQGSSVSAASAANADIARQNAALAMQEGRKKEAQATGAQTVAYAKGGVVTSTGTPLMVMANTVRDIELEALRERAKWLYQAEQYEDAAGASKIGGLFGAMSKGLGGFGTILGNFIKKDQGKS